MCFESPVSLPHEPHTESSKIAWGFATLNIFKRSVQIIKDTDNVQF